MGKNKKFDKKTAKTYSLVYRSHEDALYFDNDASTHVLVEVPRSRKKNEQKTIKTHDSKALGPSDLEQEPLPNELKSIRQNEGLAAQYGILYDDSSYDYMQHLKPIGQCSDSIFIQADDKTPRKPHKTKIDDVIKDMLPSENKRTVNFDELDSIPHELQGFNPDLDPRLCEVLEALEDEAYLENDAENVDDLFADLLQSGEIDRNFDYGPDYGELDMDNYQGEYDLYDVDYVGERIELDTPYSTSEAPEGNEGQAVVDSAWEKDFQKFQERQKKVGNDWDSDNEFGSESEGESERNHVLELPEIGNSVSKSKKKPKNRIRKKMGAMSDTSAFSMSSSALFRTEGLTLLDNQYEQLLKKFKNDEESENKVKTEFSMQDERQDLEEMLDDFLGNYELDSGGRKLVKKDKRIDEIKEAADSVSRGKAAQKRRRNLNRLGSLFGRMSI